MGRSPVVVVTLAVFLVLPLVSTVPAAGTPTHAGTTIDIQVQPDGDAVWTVQAQYNLTTANDTAAFERLRTEFEAGESQVGLSADLFREAAARVSERTGREMEIVDVGRTSQLTAENGTQVGVLILQFTWTNFAVVDEEQISVGSSFAGGWFGDLGADQTLQITPPTGYRVQTANPSTDIMGGTLRWEGPQAFDPGQPSIEFRTLTSPTTPGTTPGGVGISWSYAAIGFLVLIVGALVLLAWQGDYLGGTRTAGSDSGGPPDQGAAESEAAGSGSTPEPGEGAEPGTAPDVSDSELEDAETPAGAAGAAAAGEGEETDEEGAVDTDLLSDEERVERLLRQHGGRMKQAQIVEETRWSNAKVSQLLSAMAEEKRVEKLRIGRENLISLPDYDEET